MSIRVLNKNTLMLIKEFSNEYSCLQFLDELDESNIEYIVCGEDGVYELETYLEIGWEEE